MRAKHNFEMETVAAVYQFMVLFYIVDSLMMVSVRIEGLAAASVLDSDFDN